MTSNQPFALFVRGPKSLIFDLSDQLGFDSEMEALAVSIFEDDETNEIFHVQALYASAADANAALESLCLPKEVEGFVSQLPDEDWVALSQKGLPPVDAGRFWIFGGHDRAKVPHDIPWPIHIEAGAAFGTGHHGTTKGCLLMFDQLLKDGTNFDRVLDLGCGAGVLAIAAALSLKQSVMATDIDPDAVSVSLDNAVQNEVGPLVDAFHADGFNHQRLSGQTFDLIFANILAGPLMALAPDIKGAMTGGGHVILSGILDEQAGRVARAFEAQGFAIKKGPSLAGWTSLLGLK
ncbi:MAG: 50S ribosomal protein L11 methyltransferase [Hellea sp.]|nr:50S ribosomal protein L11 methyltransferase [Hellea sp.]